MEKLLGFRNMLEKLENSFFLSLSILQKRAVHSAYCQLSKTLHFFEEFICSKILQAFKCGLVSESPTLKKMCKIAILNFLRLQILHIYFKDGGKEKIYSVLKWYHLYSIYPWVFCLSSETLNWLDAMFTKHFTSKK